MCVCVFSVSAYEERKKILLTAQTSLSSRWIVRLYICVTVQDLSTIINSDRVPQIPSVGEKN